jgi:Holliday junction resolvase RusA-like endonuclease
MNYMDVMRVKDELMLKLIGDMLSGKAKGFYIDYVATKQHRWTIAKLIPALFDFCFPNDTMEQLRKKWENITQGKRRVQDYAREIEKLARRFREVNERQVVLTFWKGLHANIRGDMVLLNVDPELDDLNTVLAKALVCERSREQRATILKGDRERRTEGENPKPKKEWTRFKNRNGGARHFKPAETEEKPASNKSDKIRVNAVSPQNTPENKPKAGYSGKKLSRAKLDALRAEGKCFNCRETGHEQRNCPKLQSMKPPKAAITAGSVRFTQMEKLAAKKEQADILVGSILVIESDPIADELRELEEIEFRVHKMCEEAWGEDPLWYNEETRPDCKYSIGADNEEVTIWDFVNGGERTFARAELEDPNFSIADIFKKPEPNRTPTSVREGGYPDAENYLRWDWPAIKWLYRRLSRQLEFADGNNAPDGVKEEDRIDVQPTMFGYSVQLDESDIVYNLTHEEVLDEHFSPEWIIDHMLTARHVPSEDRGDRFTDKRFSNYVTLMLGMTTIPGSQTKIKRRGNKKRILDPEGATAIERTTMRIKDKARRFPDPIIIQIKINGQPMRALLDTRSMADFLSTTVADQLQLTRETYEKPIAVQLAVHGSRSKINCGTTVKFQYQTINCDRRFNIANIDNYDAILGTPFLYQHQVAIGFNPSRVIVGSSDPLELRGPDVSTITSATADLLNQGLDEIRKELRQEAEDLCPDTSMTALPPLRAVNHTIPLKDEKKIYRFRPSKCPEAFRDQWRKKKNAYLETGRWRTATGHNAIPLLMIPKPSTTNGQPSLRTVFDKREQNANTHKLASPLPDIEEILREVSRHKYPVVLISFVNIL